MKFTGEFFVPGASGERIEQDHLARYKFAAKFVRGKSVLDIACGTGYGGPLLQNAGARSYCGVDIQDSLVSQASEKYGNDCISYVLGDVTSLDMSETYDVVISFETIEHVSDYRNALRCLRSAIRPGGKLLISSPNRPITTPGATSLKSTPLNKYHTQEFTIDELVQLLQETGLHVSEKDIFGQRLRPSYLFGNSLFNRIARRIDKLNYDLRGSGVVEPVRKKTPRYFLLIASVPD